MIELADAFDAWLATPAAGAYRNMHMPFAALTASFDIARRLPRTVDPDGDCYLGIGAKHGLQHLPCLGCTYAERMRTLLLQADKAVQEFSTDATATLCGRTLNAAAVERALCEFAKYRAYATGTKRSYYAKRPVVLHPAGYRNKDGTLRTPATCRKVFKTRQANGR